MRHHIIRLFSGLATVALLLAVPVSAQVIKAYNFDDNAATELTALVGTGSAAGTFPADIANLTTNGTGQLVAAGNYAASAYSYANIGSFGPDTGTSMKLSMTFSSWNFAATPLSETFYVALRSTNSQTSSLVGDITVLNSATTGVTLRFRDSAVTVNLFTNGNLVQSSPVTVDLAINRLIGANDTYDLSYTIGGSTTVVATGAALGTGSSGRTVTQLQVGVLGNFSTGSSIALDALSLTDTAIPEPSTYASAAGFGVLALAMLRRRRSAASRR
jgi:hypothetical protein